MMIKKLSKLFALGSLAVLFTSTPGLHAENMSERIQTAYQILDKKQHSDEPIPSRVLAKAKGIAIFTVTKAGLGVGGLGGEGIVISRISGLTSNAWTAPSAFNLGGATVGAQIGFSETRYIVILNTDEAVQQFTSKDKFTWNATAMGNAGDASETERVTTSDLEKRETVVYKDSGGVFGGATLGGTSIERKDEINRQAYGENVTMKDIGNGTIKAPKSAERLYRLVDGKA